MGILAKLEIVKYLLNLAGFELCPVCNKWTMEWEGWVEDSAPCSECHAMLVEAHSLTRHVNELRKP
jgi:hypothetical protein